MMKLMEKIAQGGSTQRGGWRTESRKFSSFEWRPKRIKQRRLRRSYQTTISKRGKCVRKCPKLTESAQIPLYLLHQINNSLWSRY